MSTQQNTKEKLSSGVYDVLSKLKVALLENAKQVGYLVERVTLADKNNSDIDILDIVRDVNEMYSELGKLVTSAIQDIDPQSDNDDDTDEETDEIEDDDIEEDEDEEEEEEDEDDDTPKQEGVE